MYTEAAHDGVRLEVMTMDKAVRIAIVEDSGADREVLRSNLQRYEKEKDVRFDLTEFTDGEDLVVGYTADYDLILMDIQMSFMDGMKAAKKIREMDTDVVIVFISNTPQYAIEGYRVNAVDYMLKPISWFSFSESLARALLYVRPREKEFVTISLKGGRTRLEPDRICYVEAQDHVLVYNTQEGSFSAKGTMRDAEAQLSAKRFFRCNRCYLVNLKYVEAYQGCDVRVNGDVIQVSRRRRKSFLDALNIYMNGENP